MLSKATLKFVNQLHQKKYRHEHQLFIVEGEKITAELLQTDFKIHSMYAYGEWINDNKAIGEFPVHLVSEKELASMSMLEVPNKVLAVVHQKPSPDFKINPEKNYLLLDAIRDPGNMGTIIRIADWFGFHHVVCSPDCVETMNSKVIQASMGSVFRVTVNTQSLPELLNDQKDKINVYGAMLEGKSMYDTRFARGTILVIGNESNGISADLKKYIHHAVTIPLYNKEAHHAESLNAAVATALFCAEICRQQQ